MIDFHFKTYGEKSKQPLLMLHGFMGESSDFDSLAGRLKEDYFCIALDLPGHGQNRCDDEAEYTIEETSHAIIEFLTYKKIKSPHLYGYSMGGRIAYNLLTSYPNYFDKAILESALPGIKSEIDRAERKKNDLLLAEEICKQPMNLFLEEWYHLDMFSSMNQNSANFKEMIKRKLKNDSSKLGLSLKYSGTGAMKSLWDLLPDIQTQVLCISGELDKKFCSIAQEVCDMYTNFSHLIFDDISHNVHFEQEEKFAHIVKKYFK